ncbi:molybdenum cofactor biosynthesis protein B [Pseudomonas lopnurensis]|uniref:molybdenum cofactor biosynthesis protein B n=1 Tax=Pseudomonas lopnurensis TaxID=1477517 RepID=UPI00187AAB44|nr:molybdenum cofactor biosynthesis protein B [Pseudomonas lopnurensis]MBE7376200.1 molybdenum cofactor biosynthesis protein B [Pseudomonas lopnurensis]
MAHLSTREFQPLDIAVLTVSDTRTLANDTSGQVLVDNLEEAGHRLADRAIVVDDIWQIRARISAWIADEAVQVVLVTGGTGFTARDNTPQAVQPLLDKPVDGFGELFRHVSLAEIGTSALQSRALAGISNGTLVCCLPGSPNACRTGWRKILGEQLDSRTGPCNFVAHLKASLGERSQASLREQPQASLREQPRVCCGSRS